MNLSNEVDWTHIFLVAVIQQGVDVSYGDESCSRGDLLPAQIQH